MAIYVMSDIHGEYEKYRRMLEQIGFSDEDELFVLGDVVDRGEQPMAVLRDMMRRPNVFPLFGNHDLLALDVLRKLAVDITEDNYATQVDIKVMNELLGWLDNGGQTTINDFRSLSKEEQTDILDYIASFSLCEAVDAGDKLFILVHAGLGNFRKGKRLREYTAYELLEARHEPDERYFDDDDVYVVMGHTPTPTITGKAEIYHSNHNIYIDCGAFFIGGRLACLCLDTMEEFYV